MFAYGQPVSTNPAALVTAYDSLRGSGQFTAISGPLNANGRTLTAARYSQLHAELGPPGRLPMREPASLTVARADNNAHRLFAPATGILLGRRNWWPSWLSHAEGPHRAETLVLPAVDPSEARS